MKKRILSLWIAVILLLAVPFQAFAARHTQRDIPLSIIINDHVVMSDVHPFIANSRTYVPIRFIAEELGYDVKWHKDTQEVEMTNEGKVVKLKINSDLVNINGTEKKIDAPALLRDDRTFVPLRTVAEAFGIPVDWSEDYHAVYVGETPKYNKFYKVVYYYKDKAPVISTYEVNITTYEMMVKSTPTKYTTLAKLYGTVETDFVTYVTTGVTQFGVTNYDKNRVDESTSTTAVKKEHQLKDEYYVKSNGLEGTYYGPSFFDVNKKLPTQEYAYLISLGNDDYLLKKRTILASEKNSQCWTEAYGHYDHSKNILRMQKSHTTYGETGFFVNKNVYSLKVDFYIEQNGNHLSWGKPNNPDYYFDKY